VARIGLATCQEFPLLDEDDQLLIPALAALGIEGVPAVWTDPTVDWGAFDTVVVRGTWDYANDRDAYLAWVDHVSTVTRLFNPASVVRWNTDKRYLRDLVEAGVPVVPTMFLEPGDDPQAWQAEQPRSWREIVVKPAVSCGSRDTARYDLVEDSGRIADHAGGLLTAGRTTMVQPYIASVDLAGETALLYFDGEFSHAIRKGPLLARGEEGEQVEGLFLREQIDPRDPTDDELDVGRRALDVIPGGAPLYARVDLIRDADMSPMVLELELTEPSVFLAHSTGAADRFAAAIARCVTGA